MIGQPNKKAPGRTVRLRPQDSAVAGNLPTPRAGHNRGYLSRRSRSESSSTSFSRSQSKDGAETACYGPPLSLSPSLSLVSLSLSPSLSPSLPRSPSLYLSNAHAAPPHHPPLPAQLLNVRHNRRARADRSPPLPLLPFPHCCPYPCPYCPPRAPRGGRVAAS